MKDGIIDDPRRCHFDPTTLLCKGAGAESDGCLTPPQVSALKRIYLETRTTRGEQIYPGNFPGGETGPSGWSPLFTGNAFREGLPSIFAKQGSAYMVFQNPAWDYPTFKLDRDVKIADDTMGHVLNSSDPNLKAFNNRGGKLILFHGWSDPSLPPSNTVDYYESVAAKMGREDSESFTRLFMVPGMQHCGDGPGPNSFGLQMTSALERWVEQGVAPDKIIATKYKTDDNPSSGVVRTRPLCPYPQVARYKGSGSIDDAANFACRMP